jgi:hypothetical protein
MLAQLRSDLFLPNIEQLSTEFVSRYNCVLQVVISYTEKLAYKQAADADDMIKKGIYLGMFSSV